MFWCRTATNTIYSWWHQHCKVSLTINRPVVLWSSRTAALAEDNAWQPVELPCAIGHLAGDDDVNLQVAWLDESTMQGERNENRLATQHWVACPADRLIPGATSCKKSISCSVIDDVILAMWSSPLLKLLLPLLLVNDRSSSSGGES